MWPAAPASEAQWPPRSPHEALVSTPGGRERYRRMLDRTSPSPSPRRARNAPTRNLLAEMEREEHGDEAEEEDEDEETLQLKLQEIQARLRLKKLQAAKSRKQQAEDDGETSGGSFTQLSMATSTRSRTARGATPSADEPPKSHTNHHIQVPASPVRKIQAPQPQTSPSRVLLGIDKGLKAKDISLKRAPVSRKSQQGDGPSKLGGYLRRSRTPNPESSSFEDTRPMTFNERLASVREEEVHKAERQARIQQVRTNAFGINQNEMEVYKKSAVDIPDEPVRPPSFSRDEVLSQSTSTGLKRSSTAAALESSNKSTALIKRPPEEQGASFEPYSSFHLSNRILPHPVLARHVTGKKSFSIKDLYRVVKAPDFALPDIEQDIVIFAILAKKSEPRAHKPATAKNGTKQEDRGKYMVMTLVDLELEVDLFLFNSGFTRFWKLTEGTVVAILNPNVMPPPPGRQDTGRFSLVINSDEDTIIEVGTARDLGACQSVKKDGSLCAAWVNKKRTQFCEFHSNEAIRKQRSSRMEVNNTGFGARKFNSRETFGFGKKEPPRTAAYDRDTGTHWFTSRSMSAADLIDGKDRTAVDRKERAEFLKRGLEAKEREREMMKKLGKVGNAAGREYMQKSGSRDLQRTDSSTTLSQETTAFPDVEEPAKPDARALGLLSRDFPIHLSPIKRKRTNSSQASSFGESSRAAAFGWGSNLKQKLAKMKEGENLRKKEHSPVRKKTRFVTEKGIREAGRDSLGTDLMERQITLDDDGDELIILE